MKIFCLCSGSCENQITHPLFQVLYEKCWLLVFVVIAKLSCSVKDVLKTISDAVHSKSSFMIFLMDNNISGRFSNDVLESLLAVNAAFSCQ